MGGGAGECGCSPLSAPAMIYPHLSRERQLCPALPSVKEQDMPGTATRAVECALPTPSLGKRASVIFRLLSDDQKVLTKNFPFVSVNGYPKMQTAMALVHGVVFLSS